jgi:hypothetical protein
MLYTMLALSNKNNVFHYNFINTVCVVYKSSIQNDGKVELHTKLELNWSRNNII